MRKILELDGQTLSTGIAPNAYEQSGGLWHKGKGATVTRDIFTESESVGVLQAAPTPTDISGIIIEDKPWAWDMRVNGSVQKVYFQGDSGCIYSMNALNGTSLTNHRSGGSTDPASGCFYMKHSNGDEYLYYMQNNALARMGPLQTNNNLNDDHDTGWETTTWHPCHRFNDRVYIGNGRLIGVVSDDGSGDLTIVKDALDFENTFRTNCISNDGFYLVAGITTNTSTGNTIHGVSKIIFWDTSSSSWTREWPINDAAIYAIRNSGLGMLAITSRGIFSFSFNEPPRQLVPYLLTGDVPDYQYPTQYAVDTYGQALAFGGSDHISTFGKIRTNMPASYMKPFTGFTDAPTMVITSANTALAFVGTAGEKLFTVDYNGAGQTGVSPETVYIDLKRWYQVARITVLFERPLASGDALNIDVKVDSNTSAQDWGTASFAANGAIRTKELYNSVAARNLKLIFNFTGGSPRIKGVEVWGDPIETPTHV